MIYRPLQLHDFYSAVMLYLSIILIINYVTLIGLNKVRGM